MRLWQGVASTVLGPPLEPVTIAVVYGPIIWMAMSLVVIPIFTGRPASITYRWWVQFFGHMAFVALPMVTMIARSPELDGI